jgi:hypothetical protein
MDWADGAIVADGKDVEGERGWRAFGQGWTGGNGISVNAAEGNYGTFEEWRG